MVLTNNTKSKKSKNRVDSKKQEAKTTTKKQHKYLVYNSQHSFSKFKNIDEFKELSFDAMYKRLNDFQKIFNTLKNSTPQSDKNKDLLKSFKRWRKNGLKTKDTKKNDYKKLRLTDDYQYESEKEKEQQTSKESDKKETPKKQTKTDLSKINKWVKKKKRNRHKPWIIWETL